MIDVVTWLENNSNRNELSAICAGNGIRIVADEFENAEGFLREFDTINTKIDVLVISNSNLENIDKRSFFEDVCVTEPNLRIVIVFPGYRNEYIEEQISEYKALGIYEIIYEGQRLDEKYFADVIKKGYIYDYEVNVYDEVEDNPKPLTPPPECRTIGIMGLTHGCGVTNMAINIASYISLSEDYNVKAKDGATLNLTNISWQSAANDNIDGQDLAVRYTANATYSGTGTKTYNKGYTAYAEYKGEVKKIVNDTVTYTAVFTEVPQEKTKGWLSYWWAYLLGLLGLGSTGYGTYRLIRKRKKGY